MHVLPSVPYLMGQSLECVCMTKEGNWKHVRNVIPGLVLLVVGSRLLGIGDLGWGIFVVTAGAVLITIGIVDGVRTVYARRGSRRDASSQEGSNSEASS